MLIQFNCPNWGAGHSATPLQTEPAPKQSTRVESGVSTVYTQALSAPTANTF